MAFYGRSISCLCLALAIIADGQHESYAQSNDVGGAAQVLRWPVGRERPVLTAIQMQPGGKLVAAAGDTHRIHVWNRESGEAKWELKGHVDWVRTLSISPDGATLASGGNDGRVLLWNLETGKLSQELLRVDAAIRSVQFSQSGAMLAVAAFNEPLRVFHSESREQLFELECPCRDIAAVAFSADDWSLAIGGRNGRVRVFALDDERKFRDYQAHRRRIRDLEFSHDRTVLSCGDDGRVISWDPTTEKTRTLTEAAAKLFCLVSTADGQLAVGGADNLVRLVDKETGRTVRTLRGHEGTVAAISVSQNSLATCGFDTTIRIWPQNSDRDGTIQVRASGPKQRDDSGTTAEKQDESKEVGRREPPIPARIR